MCWFSPIAKSFPYSCYDDFGAVRTYGYTRPHLGHDLMAAVGTPVVAVESGTVEIMGWNSTAVGESESVLPTKNAIGTMPT